MDKNYWNKNNKKECLEFLESMVDEMEESKVTCHLCKEERTYNEMFEYLNPTFKKGGSHELYCSMYAAKKEFIIVKGKWDCREKHLLVYTHIIKCIREALRLITVFQKRVPPDKWVVFKKFDCGLLDVVRLKRLFSLDKKERDSLQ